jgi:hypothetical protein
MGTAHTFSGSNPTRDQFTGAIVQWVNTRRVAAALSHEQIGALPGFERIDALRKAAVIHAVMRCRNNPRADCTEAVVRLIEIMSDNEKGMCTLSQDRMARILSRSRRAIVDVMAKLREAGTISTADSCGRMSGYMLTIPQELACQNHRVWLIEALETTCELDFTGDAKKKQPVKSSSRVKLSTACEATLLTPEKPDFSGQHRTSEADFTRQKEKTQPSGEQPVKSSAQTCEVTLLPTSLRDLTKASREDLGDGRDSTSMREPRFEARPPEVSWPGQVAKAAMVAGMIAAAPMSGLPAAASEPPAPPAHVQAELQPASCWLTAKAKMAAGMSADERRAQFQVWKTKFGMVEVAGDFKAELELVFPDVDLTAGLAAVAPNVHFDHGAQRVMLEILRQFGLMQNDAKGKDKRYQASVAKSAPPKRSGPPPGFSYAKG